MFMKHYAPNRCLYIKVAKLRTGVGSAEMSHLQNCSLKIYLKRALGRGVFVKIQNNFFFFFFFVGGGGGQGRCEQRSDVFVKIQNKISLFCFFGGTVGVGEVGGGGGGGKGGGQGGCEQRIEVFGKIHKKKFGGGGGGGGGVGGDCDVCNI